MSHSRSAFSVPDKTYPKPGKLTLGLSITRLIGMSRYWNKYTDEDSIHQWADFELEKLLYLKQISENSHNQQLPCWYFREGQSDRRTHRSMTPGLKGPLIK